jgi:hypothetical protein
MMPIDSQFHILKADEIAVIRKRLSPAVLIPMHYRHDDLELVRDKPEQLGGIDDWAKAQSNVRYLGTNKLDFASASLPKHPEVLIFKHSPLVRPPTKPNEEENAVPVTGGALSLIGPAIAFRKVHQRWPKDLRELSPMLTEAGRKAETYDQVKLTGLPDGGLEILAVDRGQTNRITLPVQEFDRR